MERKRQHTAFFLVLQVQWRRFTKGAQQRIARESSRRLVYEALGELEGLSPFVAIQAQHKIGLYVGHITEHGVYVLRYLVYLFAAVDVHGAGFITQLVP